MFSEEVRYSYYIFLFKILYIITMVQHKIFKITQLLKSENDI